MVKLGEVCTLNPRKDKAIASDTTISFIEMKSLLENGSVFPVLQPAEKYLKGYSPFQKQDVLVAKITPCFQNNKIGVASIETEFGFGTTEFHVLRVHQELLLSEYLVLFLRQQQVLVAGEGQMTGSGGQRRVPKSFFENLLIPLPSLNEQKRIAEILGGVSETIQKVEQQIKMLDVVAESSFNRLCGSPENYSERVKLGQVASISTGNTPSRKESSYYGDFIEWIKSDNLGGVYPTLANEYLSEKGMKKGRLAQPGSMLMTCIAGSLKSIGKLSIVDRTMAFNQQINAIKPVEVDDLHYLYLLFKIAPQLVQRRSTGGLKGIVKKTSLEECEIPWPPQEVREKLAEFCQEWIMLHGLLHQKLTLLQELQRSLSARAFAGQL